MKLLTATITLIMSFFFGTSAFAYTVKEGDTLTDIAFENNLSIQELAELNPQIQDLDLIITGEKINTQLPGQAPSVEVSKSYEIYVGRIVNTTEPKVNINDSETIVEALPISKKVPKTITAAKTKNYSDYELDLLARLVRAEAQTEPFEGKVAVACVVLNRVESSKFPDTIKEVVYARGQFQPVSNGEINEPADTESIAAVKAALTNKRNIAANSLFFYNPDIATSRWLDSRATTIVIGQHVFKM